MTRPDWYCDEVSSGKLDVIRVWEDERVLAFRHPKQCDLAEIHVVVIPRKHIDPQLSPEALDGELLVSVLRAVQFVAAKYGFDYDGFYLRSNAGTDGVTPHMHRHIYGPGIP
ncbi:MAG: HIT domain-containing protein [Anaerolineaceae bacterium]